MKKDSLDELFDQIFEEAVKETDLLPDPEQSWKKVRSRLLRRERRAKICKSFAYGAAAFFLGAFIFSSPIISKAFYPIYQILQSAQDGMVTFFFGSEDAGGLKTKTTPPPSGQRQTDPSPGRDITKGSTEESHATWEDAKKYVSFEAPNIGGLPKGYRLNLVRTSRDESEEKASSAVLIYAGPQNESLTITMRSIKPNERWKSNYKTEDGRLETLDINGRNGYLFIANDGTTSMEFLENDLYIWIVGILSRDEILTLAKNIQ